MQLRLHMSNKRLGWMMEAPATKQGRIQLEVARKARPSHFKRARITEVIQACPSKIDFYKPYPLD